MLRITEGVLKLHYTLVENENKVTITSHSNTSNIRVVDEATGTSYVGSWEINYKEHYVLSNYYPYQFKQILSLVLTTPGQDNNIMLKADFHFKYDADGNLTTYIDNYRIDCQK
ncbi:hypothetical protein OB13_15500 [Pontibacter sp. HJ8]